MIVIVMGMSKSGTTLISKTLHESGIDMNPGKTGNYNQSKYEDPEMIDILFDMFQIDRLKSLYIPPRIKMDADIIERIKNYVDKRKNKKHWGVKQPWLTLCYNKIKKYFPPHHFVIGIKRSPEGLINHWVKRGKKVCREKLLLVQNIYNLMMNIYDIPVLSFEDFLKNGPKRLEKIIGIKLKDVRA